MTDLPPKRLLKTMTGHYHELMAVFSRTSAHKLPSAMGALREDAVAKFVKTWLSNRYTVPTNVFATTRAGNEYPSELDLVIHDGNEGGVWPLDADHGNSIASWEEINLVVQVKSTLDEGTFESACKSMRDIGTFAETSGTERPFTALFAFRVAEDFHADLLEKFVYSSSGTFPFDAFFLLNEGAYFSDALRELRVGLQNGLGPTLVRNDGRSQDTFILEDCIETRIPNGYRCVGSSPEEILLSLAALATLATGGEETTQALIAACMHSEHRPIF